MSLSVAPIPPPSGSTQQQLRALAYSSLRGVAAPPEEVPPGAARDSKDISGLPGLQVARRQPSFIPLPDVPYGTDSRPPGAGARHRWRDSSGQVFEPDPFPKEVPKQAPAIVAASLARRAAVATAIDPRFGWIMYLVPFVAAGPSPSASGCIAGHELLVQAQQLAELYHDFAGAREMRLLHESAPWPRLAHARAKASEAIAEAEALARTAARAAAARKGRPITQSEADAVKAGALIPADSLARADRFGWSRAFGVDARVLGEPPARLPLTADAKDAQKEAHLDCTRVILMPPKEKIPEVLRAMRGALSEQWVAREQAARKVLAEQARALARAKAQAKAEAKADGKGKKGRGRGRGKGKKQQQQTNGGGTGAPFGAPTGATASGGLLGQGPDGGIGAVEPGSAVSVSAEQFRLTAEQRAAMEPSRPLDEAERESGRRLLIVDGSGTLDAVLLEWMAKVPSMPPAPSDGALEGCPVAAGVSWLRKAHARCTEIVWKACCAGDTVIYEGLRAAGVLPSQQQQQLDNGSEGASSSSSSSTSAAAQRTDPASNTLKKSRGKAPADVAGELGRPEVHSAIEREVAIAREMLREKDALLPLQLLAFGEASSVTDVLPYASGVGSDGKKGRHAAAMDVDESTHLTPRLQFEDIPARLELQVEEADRSALGGFAASSTSASAAPSQVTMSGSKQEQVIISSKDARALLASGLLVASGDQRQEEGEEGAEGQEGGVAGRKRPRPAVTVSGASDGELAQLRAIVAEAACSGTGGPSVPVRMSAPSVARACRTAGMAAADASGIVSGLCGQAAWERVRSVFEDATGAPAQKRARASGAAAMPSSASAAQPPSIRLEGLAAIRTLDGRSAMVYGGGYGMVAAVKASESKPPTEPTAAAARPSRKSAKGSRRQGAGQQASVLSPEEARESILKALTRGGKGLLDATKSLDSLEADLAAAGGGGLVVASDSELR